MASSSACVPSSAPPPPLSAPSVAMPSSAPPPPSASSMATPSSVPPPPSCSAPPPSCALQQPLAGGSTSLHKSPLPPLTSRRCPVPQPHPQEQLGINGGGSGDGLCQVREEAQKGFQHVERGRRQHQGKRKPQDRRERAPRQEKQVVGSSPAATTPIPASTTARTPSLAQEGEVLSSVRKENVPRERQKKTSGSQRLRSSIVSFSIRSPGLRIVLSPRINPTSPSPSPSPSLMLPRKYRKRRKLTSEIWKDFEAIYDGNSVSKAECIHCHKRIKVARNVGTSTCLRHLRSCEEKARLDQLLNQMNPNDLQVPNDSLKDWKFDQEKSRQELVCLIVVHALPFSLVEYPRFRSFVSSLNPWFTHVSRTTIKSDCIRTYEEAKAELHKVLSNSSSRVSLTADLWTSNQTLGYLCVTCHYIRNWKLYKRVIKFALVETPHDGRNLFNAMLKSLNEWNIQDKVFAITLDNASNNNNFVSALKENLVAKHLLLGEGKMFHCRCAAHVLNLIVQEGLAAMSGAVTSIRDSVKYVKSSQGRKQRFEKVIQDVGISCEKRPPLDVVTRWNSTYQMLECAMKYKRAFEALTREDFQYMHEPLVEEWKMAKKLCDILEKFNDATKVLSGSKYPTSTLYFDQIWDIKLLLEDESSNPDVLIAGMVHEMKEKFEKYWDLCFLQICVPVIIDPRFKLGYLKFRLRQGFGDASSLYFPTVEKTFRELFEEYSLEFSNLSPAYAKTTNTVETNVGRTNPWADWSQHQNLIQRRRVSELDKYLQEETVPIGVPFDILEYWKTSSATYPILARMARDILAIPASTVASESAFSSGEKIISDYRSRLTSETVEALICLQDWIRGNDTITHDDIAGWLIGDEEDDEL